MLIVLLFFSASSSSIAQDSNNTSSFKHELGFGGMYYGNSNFLLSSSYTKIFKNSNELIFPVYYFKYGNRKAISGSISFCWTTNKNSRFSFNLIPELNLYFEWQHKFRSELYSNRYGFITYLGLSPSYKISPRFKISLDLKIGHGYLWSKNNTFNLPNNFTNIIYRIEDDGWLYFGDAIFRVNYFF